MAVVPTPSDPATHELVARMLEYGVSRALAEELCRDFSPTDIARQIEALPYRAPRQPAHCLIRSIKDGWGIPAQMVRGTLHRNAGRMDAYWQGVACLQRSVENAIMRRENGEVLRLWATEQRAALYPNLIDGSENACLAELEILAHELGLLPTPPRGSVKMVIQREAAPVADNRRTA